MPVHEAPVAATVEWYTPPELFDRLGLEFRLDPACGDSRLCRVPATLHLSSQGHVLPWLGRVWLNPPYGPAGVRFIERMLDHRDGLLLLPARTETRIFQRAAQSAELVVFLRDRLHFIREDGMQARSSFASVLMAWGPPSIAALIRADLGWWVA